MPQRGHRRAPLNSSVALQLVIDVDKLHSAVLKSGNTKCTKSDIVEELLQFGMKHKDEILRKLQIENSNIKSP